MAATVGPTEGAGTYGVVERLQEWLADPMNAAVAVVALGVLSKRRKVQTKKDSAHSSNYFLLATLWFTRTIYGAIKVD